MPILTSAMIVTNAGPAEATDVEVSMALPAHVTFVGSDNPHRACSGPAAGTAGTVNCELGALESGETVALSITVRTATAGPLALSMTVSGNETDPSAANNSATVSVTVSGPVVIEIVEVIAVTRCAGLQPSALLTVAETIAVQDSPNVRPSALVGITESIVVTDGMVVQPSALLIVAETVVVADTPEVQPAGNTPRGSDVVVRLADAATGSGLARLTFDTVTQPGDTVLVIGAVGPPPPPGFEHGNPPCYYDLSTDGRLHRQRRGMRAVRGNDLRRAPDAVALRERGLERHYSPA